jgi:hypothetical protein
LLDLTLAEARAGFDDLSVDELDSLIEEAVADGRKHQAMMMVRDREPGFYCGTSPRKRSNWCIRS